MYRVAIVTGAVLVLATTVAVHQSVVTLLHVPGVREAGDVRAQNPSATVTAKLSPAPNADAGRPQVPQHAAGSNLSFDVVNIDPQGTSVFAGQAPTNSSVVITANGRVVATTTADETGAWAVATDRKLPAGDYEFTLSTQPALPDAAPGQSVRVVVPASPAQAPETRAQVGSVQSIATPITFLYNETAFTAQGREAADTLAKRLLAQRPAVVALSGHADERGSDLYNMELSRRRLSVVADFLRESGFAGKLELIAKGRSEPYAGIDRNTLSKEQAFQLDRRVELVRAP
jgi:outer membrane protein OmpA-like peptidoglycan-associated protein